VKIAQLFRAGFLYLMIVLVRLRTVEFCRPFRAGIFRTRYPAVNDWANINSADGTSEIFCANETRLDCYRRCRRSLINLKMKLPFYTLFNTRVSADSIF